MHISADLAAAPAAAPAVASTEDTPAPWMDSAPLLEGTAMVSLKDTAKAAHRPAEVLHSFQTSS